MEASQGHLIDTPFHAPLQKVRGYVGGFSELRRETRNDQSEIRLYSWIVKRKIIFGNNPGFAAEIDDSDLKWWDFWE